MRASLLCLLLLAACNPFASPGREGHYTITGRDLTDEQETNLRDRIAAGYACARRAGREPRQHVRNIHIEPTCRFLYAQTWWVRGIHDGRDVRVGWCTRAAGHEALSVAFGHSDISGPAVDCEHEGPKPFACKCPEK